MDFNLDEAREELDNFQMETNDVSPLLESYLQVVAKTGNTLFPWIKLQPLLKRKLELVLSEFTKSCPPESIPSLPNTDTFDFDNLKNNLLDAVDAFTNAPFTVQRLCELIINPKKHYNRTDKYMRGLEKNLIVVSTVESSENSRNLIPVVNGRVSNSADIPYNDATNANDDSTQCSPPSNGPVLENFASVFPSATRLAAPSNNIQVPVISDTNNFLPNECVEDFNNYDVNENVSIENNEIISSNVDSDAPFIPNSVENDLSSESETLIEDESSESTSVIDVLSNSDTSEMSESIIDNLSSEAAAIGCDSVSVINEATNLKDSEEVVKTLKSTEQIIEESKVTIVGTIVNEIVSVAEKYVSNIICSAEEKTLISEESSGSDANFEHEDPLEPSPKRRKLNEDNNESVSDSIIEDDTSNEVTMIVDDKNEIDQSEDKVEDENNEPKDENLSNKVFKVEEGGDINNDESVDHTSQLLNGNSEEVNDNLANDDLTNITSDGSTD